MKCYPPAGKNFVSVAKLLQLMGGQNPGALCGDFRRVGTRRKSCRGYRVIAAPRGVKG
jgi:hypothetical protein